MELLNWTVEHPWATFWLCVACVILIITILSGVENIIRAFRRR